MFLNTIMLYISLSGRIFFNETRDNTIYINIFVYDDAYKTPVSPRKGYTKIPVFTYINYNNLLALVINIKLYCLLNYINKCMWYCVVQYHYYYYRHHHHHHRSCFSIFVTGKRNTSFNNTVCGLVYSI